MYLSTMVYIGAHLRSPRNLSYGHVMQYLVRMAALRLNSEPVIINLLRCKVLTIQVLTFRSSSLLMPPTNVLLRSQVYLLSKVLGDTAYLS